MFLYESNKRLTIIRRIQSAFIRLPLFSFLRMQSDATFRCQNAIEERKNLQNRRNGNFLIHANSNNDIPLYTYSNYEYISIRETCEECLESGIESETRECITKNNEPIRERCDNRAALLALKLIKLNEIKPVTVLFKLTLSVTTLNLNYPS